uniref:Ovarian cancer-associated gene 2 protein homolog n=1 Tax=Schistocephalus solidus TaxID=70667 RepID=A0A0X3PD30_SCHSO
MTLRILCIHGYRQTGSIFREKSGAFRKIFKNSCEFVFIDAPLTIPDVGDNVQGLGWWFSREDNTFKAQENTDYLCGFDKSVSTVKEALRSQVCFGSPLLISRKGSV